MLRAPLLGRLLAAPRAVAPAASRARLAEPLRALGLCPAGARACAGAAGPGAAPPFVGHSAQSAGGEGGARDGARRRRAALAAACGALALWQSGYTGHALTPLRCDGGGTAAVAPKAEPSFAGKLVAEAVGTGIIVLGGCGCVASKVYCNSGIAIGAVAAAWGMSVALAAYTTRDVSGAHLNPAVTAALAVCKPEACPKEQVLPYWLAQMLGATVAGAINFVVFNAAISAFEAKEAIVRGALGSSASFNGAFGMIPNAAYVTPAGACLIEVLATAALLYLIFAVTDPKGTVPDGAGPALVGATVAMLLTTFAPLTGCGLNPARDLGPRLVTWYAGWGSQALQSWWVYTVGPLVGGVLGGALYQASCAK